MQSMSKIVYRNEVRICRFYDLTECSVDTAAKEKDNVLFPCLTASDKAIERATFSRRQTKK